MITKTITAAERRGSGPKTFMLMIQEDGRMVYCMRKGSSRQEVIDNEKKKRTAVNIVDAVEL